MHPILKAWMSTGGSQKILLMRHGDIRIDRRSQRFIGQTDLPLSDTGRQQAQWWRKRLASIALQRIVCSDLIRCVETARIIAADHHAAVKPMPSLRELHLGAWENLSVDQVKVRWPNAYQRRGQAMDSFRPPGGESFIDLQQRVLPTFEEIVEGAAGPVLIVAHAGVNRMILCHVLGLPPANLFRRAQDTAALNLIDRMNDGYRIQTLNLPPA